MQCPAFCLHPRLTSTITDQIAVEDDVTSLLELAVDRGALPRRMLKFDTALFVRDDSLEEVRKEPVVSLLPRAIHTRYLRKLLFQPLPPKMFPFITARSWMTYHCLHGLALLRYELSREETEAVVAYLRTTAHPNGGMAASQSLPPHVASQYAATMACLLVQEPSLIPRSGMLAFLLRVKNEDGSFRMQEDGETDVRGAYCALAAASVAGILCPELTRGVPKYLSGCQTFDGGIGAAPGAESHAGYTYCAIATLVLLGEPLEAWFDLTRLLRWLQRLQSPIEGGFRGRPNKLVDACYTFWVGAALALLRRYLKAASCFFDGEALQAYVLFACQPAVNDVVLGTKGGFRDKPGKAPDAYHTCYALSGLSVIEHENAGGSKLGVPQVDCVLNVPSEALRRWRESTVPLFCASSGLTIASTASAGDIDSVWIGEQ